MEVVVAPMIIHVPSAKAMLHSHIQVCAQNIAAETKKAQTGEIKAEQVHDFGVKWAIVGHSERRQHYLETNELVAEKVKRCQDYHLSAIVCIGERLEEREAGHTHDVLKA
jgi:triosephosphate isomerase